MQGVEEYENRYAPGWPTGIEGRRLAIVQVPEVLTLVLLE
jgi:hypothetical protein